MIKKPMLLVLDDVWPGSEALVEKVKIDIPDYKILVTSRIEYPRFGTKILLGQLDHNQAVALFTHYAKLNENSLYRPEEDLLHVVLLQKSFTLIVRLFVWVHHWRLRSLLITLGSLLRCGKKKKRRIVYRVNPFWIFVILVCFVIFKKVKIRWRMNSPPTERCASWI
ncbi:hypothetical protein GLYMA_11G059001v4 [Glycine max]|nr:hypothetical protein GLYMA_11G059001v4 [Glycine max]